MSTRLLTRALGGTLLVLVTLTVLARAGDADALVPPPEGWGAAYERAAIEYWGETPTRCANTDIEFNSELPLRQRLDQREGPVLGQATITSAPGQQCQMWLAPMQEEGIYFRCILFAHEYGHWLGHPDDPSDPRESVLAELLGSYTRDEPCRDLVKATAGQRSSSR
jgi:hypothetical protein